MKKLSSKNQTPAPVRLPSYRDVEGWVNDIGYSTPPFIKILANEVERRKFRRLQTQWKKHTKGLIDTEYDLLRVAQNVFKRNARRNKKIPLIERL